MDSTNNPYQAPIARVAEQESTAIVPAERWRRFVNLIVDYFGFFALSIVIGAILGLAGGASAVQKLQTPGMQYLTGIVIMLIYYVPLEAMFGRTLGKLVTGTKVVDENGNPPTWGKAFGRTLCRFIPFEAFSFFKSDARGWHDSIPKTYVVKTR